MSAADRLAALISDHSKLVILALLVVTVGLGAGASKVEQSVSMEEIASDSQAVNTTDFVREEFSTRSKNSTIVLFAVQNSDENVLSKASLLRTLRYQRALRTNETVNATLIDERPTAGVANVVARTAIAQERRARANGTGTSAAATPSLEAQIEQLESMNASEVEAVVAGLVSGDQPGGGQLTQLLPREYEPGSTTAHARLVVVTQRTDTPVRAGISLSESVIEGQQAMRSLALAQSGPETYRAFGQGFMTAQQDAAMSDSLIIIGPLALFFVLSALYIAYRDLLDVLLGLVGVVLVLTWTFGAMGWLGVKFNQVMIAVPILLIGLSVDYALHAIMRYREERADPDADVRTAMSRALASVGPALVLVTLTTAIGFLANLTSPVPDLREFGIVTAIGITATLVVFGAFVPALKTELGAFLDSRGRGRRLPALGTSGRARRVLSVGSTLAKRAPLAVLAVALVLSAAGAAGGAQVDSSFSPESFMADDPPEWVQDMPEPFAPSEYFLKDNRAYIYDNFQTPDKQAQILVRGPITRSRTLERVADAHDVAASQSVTFQGASGEAVVKTPVTAMQRVAARNESFNATLAAADTDGNGVPDRNLGSVYDRFAAVAPDTAGQYLHRSDGEWSALRIRIAVVGTAEPSTIHEQMKTVADTVGTGQLSAVAAGQPIVEKEVAERLLSTVIEGLLVTLGAVLALLVVVFRLKEGSAMLGALTLVPVLFTVAWLLGSMYLLGLSFTTVTALVGSIAVGLGVDYAIHVSERFSQEIESHDPVVALERTVTGTGGALLSSAVTTAAGFGVLSFSLLPGLGQFGLILALAIVYAFVATVLVHPSLLALWARYGSPAPASTAPSEATADD